MISSVKEERIYEKLRFAYITPEVKRCLQNKSQSLPLVKKHGVETERNIDSGETGTLLNEDYDLWLDCKGMETCFNLNKEKMTVSEQKPDEKCQMKNFITW